MALTSEQRDWLRLALVPGVGTAYFIRLLARFRTPTAVLAASQRALEESVGPVLAQRIVQYADVAAVEEQERRADGCGARLVTLDDPAYPVRLAEIYDPPLVLFVRGRIQLEDEVCMAVVGTRHPTPYGVRMAEQFSRELAARGVCVVSGMALGVDGAAHRAALEVGGRTIAVLGSGVDVVYPPQHAGLLDEIVNGGGAVISQFPMGAEPSRGSFPYRNRIISGMSHGTLVVEAPASSGALITARHAAEQGREVFAIPGQLGIANAEGPHLLIQEGARLVTRAEDILVELHLAVPKSAEPPVDVAPPARRSAPERRKAPSTMPPEPASTSDMRPGEPPSIPCLRPGPEATSAIERQVLSALAPNGSHVDEIAEMCRVSVSDALSALTLLELKGLARQFSGKRFAPR